MPETRGEQLANAMCCIAACNHYMVGLVEKVTIDEMNEAEQHIIERQNKARQDGEPWKVYDLALDMLEYNRRRLFNMIN